MKNLLLTLSLLLPAAPAFAIMVAPDSPPDVEQFIAQRNECEYYRKQSNWQAHEYSKEACKGTDAQLNKLREKYSDNPDVIRELSRFEETVE